MSVPQEKAPDPNTQESKPACSPQGGKAERTGLRVALALASAAVGGAAKAVIEHVLKDDQ